MWRPDSLYIDINKCVLNSSSDITSLYPQSVARGDFIFHSGYGINEYWGIDMKYNW